MRTPVLYSLSAKQDYYSPVLQGKVKKVNAHRLLPVGVPANGRKNHIWNLL